jgi:hypothetical protein
MILYPISNFPSWIHPDKDNIEALAHGWLIIQACQRVLYWVIGQCIGCSGVSRISELVRNLRLFIYKSQTGPGNNYRSRVKISRLQKPVGIDIVNVNDVTAIRAAARVDFDAAA